MSFSTSFKSAQAKQNEILTNDYVHSKFSTFSFTNKFQNAFKLNAQVFQQIDNNNSGSTQMHNSGRIGLEYSNEDLFLSNSIDINRNIILRIDKLLQQDLVKGHGVFGKFKYEQSNTSTENSITPSFGIYKNLEKYAYKAKFNLDKLEGQVKGKAVYDKESQEKEQYGSGVSASFDFKQVAFQTVKTLLFYTNPTTSMSIQYKLYRPAVKVDEQALSSQESNSNKEMYSVFQYSLFQSLNNDTSIAVELKHDASDKKFGMIFGAAYSKFEKVICKAKIDEKFNVSSSFKITLNPNITLTISNTIDLNLRTKKYPTHPTSFPLGFKLDIQQ